MSELAGEDSILALSSLITDPGKETWLHAVNAMVEIGGEQANQYLFQTSHDSDGRIRTNVHSILTELE